MIEEIVTLQVKSGQAKSFLEDFKIAKEYISSIDGFLNLFLSQCVEDENRFVMKVSWVDLEPHTVGFRESKEYLKWKELLHHYYDPFPEVLHFNPLEI